MMSGTEMIPCLQSKREIVVVGMEQSRRGQWFGQAARQASYPVRYVDWTTVREQNLTPSVFVKLEPPKSPGADLHSLAPFAAWYGRELEALSLRAGVEYLNHPLAIRDTLDKCLGKERLVNGGIPVTPGIGEEVKHKEDLRLLMRDQKIRDLFIKPRWGSGAAGIAAYRLHPATGQQVLYTSMKRREDGRFYNTKHLFRLSDSGEIDLVLDFLLHQPVILERWMQKAKYRGRGYDLRAVYQFGRLDFLVARGSLGPMTNLQLNNHPIPIEDLNLPDSAIYAAEEICRCCLLAFPGLMVGGIDLLITPSGRFMVIEVNGQGDLIYQDIFDKNVIYRRQVEEGVKRYG